MSKKDLTLSDKLISYKDNKVVFYDVNSHKDKNISIILDSYTKNSLKE